MNLPLKRAGLSARRKTNYSVRISKRSCWALLLAVPLLLSSCHEKTNGQTADGKKKITSTAPDSVSKPKVNIKVNKHYDDKGNVVGFDSTYTSFYSNVQGDTSRMDSLMGSFDKYFNKDYSSIFKNEFNSLFFNDSLRYPDFFHNDYFMKRYELNDHYFRDMMNRMDSIKNQFYQQHSDKGQKNSGDL
jgi:hypothetical protein